MKRRLAALATLSLAGAALGAAPARAAEQQAYATALNYATPAVLAGKGDTLRFNNLDPLAQHNIVSDTPGQFSSPLIGNGQSALVTGVDKLAPATYQFHCTLHAWMRGAIQVADSSAPGPPPPPPPPSPGDAPNPVDLLPKLSPAPLTASECSPCRFALALVPRPPIDSSWHPVTTLRLPRLRAHTRYGRTHCLSACAKRTGAA